MLLFFTIVFQQAWNAYPYTKSTYDVPFLGDRFSMTIETIYKNDHGTSENVWQESYRTESYRWQQLHCVRVLFCCEGIYQEQKNSLTLAPVYLGTEYRQGFTEVSGNHQC